MFIVGILFICLLLPYSVMSTPLIVPSDLNKTINLVVFDMDLTILKSHSRGYVTYKPTPEFFSTEDIDSLITDTFKELVPKLIDQNILIGIATYSDRDMGSQQPKVGIAGEELVKEVVKHAFPSNYQDIMKKIFIAAWIPNEQISFHYGKNNHIARIWMRIKAEQQNIKMAPEDSNEFLQSIRYYDNDLWQHSGISYQEMEIMKKSTILIDDDRNNIYHAENHGYRVIHACGDSGMTHDNWNTFISQEKYK
ncbi:hypothetical protein WA158_005072 [Blastocystis sp. Blastoise]